jgi:hypothetical protein
LAYLNLVRIAQFTAISVADPIEPYWVQGKPDRVLSKQEVSQRVCDCYDCKFTEPLAQHPS